MKSFYGDKATKENDFGYAWLPKLDPTQDASWLNLFDEMYKGTFTGFFAWGMNPACSSANAGKVRQALAKLDWMVNVNVFDNETGSFWKGPGMDPKKIKTEVFQLPCAAFLEKEGSISNSGRWMQWRWKATNPPGDARPDGDIIYDLFKKVQGPYKKEKGAFPDPILNLKWDYETNGKFDIHKVAKEINGYFLEDITEHPVDKKAYKKGTLVQALFSSWMMDEPHAETGSIPPVILRPAIWLRAGRKTIRPVWDFILNGHGHGLSTAGLFTIVLLLIWRVNLVIQTGPYSNGMRRTRNGSAISLTDQPRRWGRKASILLL